MRKGRFTFFAVTLSLLLGSCLDIDSCGEDIRPYRARDSLAVLTTLDTFHLSLQYAHINGRDTLPSLLILDRAGLGDTVRVRARYGGEVYEKGEKPVRILRLSRDTLFVGWGRPAHGLDTASIHSKALSKASCSVPPAERRIDTLVVLKDPRKTLLALLESRPPMR